MEEVRQAVADQNYILAKQSFGRYIKNELRAKQNRFFSIPYEHPENIFKFPGESDAQACDRIIQSHTMISVGVAYSFGKDKPVDWHSNPTENQYQEWTWQLNRHNEIKMLAHQYNLSGDQRYAKVGIDLIRSWIRQAPCPLKATGQESKSWRTIECGIRMGANWPYILYSFFDCQYFTDDFLYEWFTSVWEHGNRLSKDYTDGNWLLMEMNGLAQIGILYPQFQQAGQWLDLALSKLLVELGYQFYPDGFHYELSTCYHEVAVNNYQRLMEVAKAFKIDIPDQILSVLERAFEINIKLMMPNGRLPDINDGSKEKSKVLLLPKQRIVPHNPNINWLISGGKEGREPDYLSIALPYSGYFIMRTSWDRDGIWGLFDGGPFGRGHQHEDKLSVLIFANQKLLITEGGNYAYDNSEMRKYVLSSRAHNTIRVDGHGQNRRTTYRWKREDIRQKSDLSWHIGENCDYAEASYSEAYGPLSDKNIIHRRSIYFIKKSLVENEPFFIVADRLSASKNHIYEILWHIDSQVLMFSDTYIKTEDMDILLAGEGLTSSIIYGQEVPEWQGFIATGTKQGMYRPLACISSKIEGTGPTIITILSPNKVGKNKPVQVFAVDEIGKNMVVRFANGQAVRLEEEKLKQDKIEGGNL